VKRRIKLFVGSAVFLMIVLIILYSIPQRQPCIIGGSNCATYKATGSALYHEVRYFVYTPFENVTKYFRGSWEYNVTVPSGETAYFVVYNPTPFGAQSCEVWVNGVRVQSASAKNGYTLTICKYQMP
jgi:hypothetical protein